jgi:hypothetical protein
MAVTVGAPGAMAQGAAPGVSFLAHQAAYDLTLKKSRRSPALDAARGRILYSFTGSACEGYTTDFRQVSQLEVGEGRATLSDLRSTSFETGDGNTYRFRIETRNNSEVTNEVEGVAERAGGNVTVKLTKPKAKVVTLDAGTVFPTEQIRRIIVAAREGKSLLELDVYDGSDTGDKAYHTLTVIGRPLAGNRLPEPADAASTHRTLAEMTRWPVTVSYYERGAASQRGEQTPVYAMSFELYENGVSRALALDYNDFVLGGAITQFDVKDNKPCKAN